MKKVISVSVLFSLACLTCGVGLPGGVSVVTNKKERNEYATKALQQLEKSSNNVNARKIIKVNGSFLLMA